MVCPMAGEELRRETKYVMQKELECRVYLRRVYWDGRGGRERHIEKERDRQRD